MLATAAAPVTRPPGTTERETALLGRPVPTDRLRSWIITLVITGIAAVVRLQNLGFPTDKGTPVFDEKHYVPQAWQMLRNGGYEDNPGYQLTVHPPLAKQLIAIGEWLFGYNGWGWRFMSAIAGIITVLLIIRIARRLTRSTFLGALAGVLLIADGVSHLMSRTGMLDGLQVPMILGAFGCLLLDREQVRQRLAHALRAGWLDDARFGPRLGFRWWRFGAGLCLGLALAVKWNGVWFIAFFGVLCVLFDVAARRAAGVRRPWVGTLRRDVAPALWALLAIPVLVYLASWWSWFASETAIDRHAAELGKGPLASWTFLPAGLRSLAYNAFSVLGYHETLATPDGEPHAWESKPWTWPMGLRPVLFYRESGAAAAGCGQDECVRATMLIGTPAMWWLSLPMVGWGLWRAIGRLDWRYAAVLAGYLGGLLPWFTNLDRQMYFFYVTPIAPFLVLGLVLILGQLLGAARTSMERRGTGLLVVCLYVGLVIANFLWLWPILNGDSITVARWNAELWLPSWR
nr:phospholipid carrier-dependent glycosyltransferase [Tamaricihabitans halophyticus]